ncbi:hypothetical protein COCSADRAFT_339247 [Bipolaris sorokiniana ND90Pr]|uniref:Uncharacterized protein n=1 Tax=Cochliobolus sativus (strain ND90Pr / ATCC 201652) TaxID=665912 RepID=M2T210_COCSN|nr:uncharacterized protein COCSADRAFT_339247 [Bipolaris sorokiniana ND90Pr]EMD63236.1 hypothetical protein COCSADRAFT_339247 [Bipolaris sorokiniana ND90Pr]
MQVPVGTSSAVSTMPWYRLCTRCDVSWNIATTRTPCWAKSTLEVGITVLPILGYLCVIIESSLFHRVQQPCAIRRGTNLILHPRKSRRLEDTVVDALRILVFHNMQALVHGVLCE